MRFVLESVRFIHTMMYHSFIFRKTKRTRVHTFGLYASSSRLSISAEQFSWFSMLTFLPHTSRPVRSLFVLLCKSVLQALRVSAPPREFFLPAPFPHTWRPRRTLREAFLRPTSAMARQDAAPPEVARKLGDGQRGRSEARGASWRVGGCEITENIGIFAWFPLFGSTRAGRPRPDGAAASLPPFHGRRAGCMGFNVDLPPALQPTLLFSFCPFVQIVRQALRGSGEFFHLRAGSGGTGGIASERGAWHEKACGNATGW